MNLFGAIAGATALISNVSFSQAPPADLVVQNANILTVDEKRPRAQALAVADGKFVAVGDSEKVSSWIGPSTRVIDADGKTVLPGFIDAHAHPRPLYPEDSRWASVDCSPANVRTIEELVGAIRRKAERTPPGQWVTGSRYQETKLGRHPTRQDLDRASTNHPILISHSSGHQSVCNSLALQLARISGKSEDPPGGRFIRDERGEPTGLLQERAAAVVRAAGPRTLDAPEHETVSAYRDCFARFVRRGITSMHVAGTSPASVPLMEQARGSNLAVRLYVMLREGDREEARRRQHDPEATNATAIRYGAIKLFHGNSLSGQTCWLSKSYAGRTNYFGVPPARSQEALNQLILSVHELGLQACVHANGDREIQMLVDAFEFALRQKPRPNHRHRIEHCSVVTPDLLRRIQELNLVVVPHSYIFEHGDKMEAYGPERWEWMHAARSMLDLGIPVAGHSDYPVSSADPLLCIQDMVTRTSAEGKVYGASQRISVLEAIRIWTLGGAYASFEEKQKGSIEPGKLADFVILESDPTRLESSQIRNIRIEKTFIGGNAVFEHP